MHVLACTARTACKASLPASVLLALLVLPMTVLYCLLYCFSEEDRKERRRKLGLPEELTDEEKVRTLRNVS